MSYLNRSGSTYLSNLLSKWDEICVCPEAEILYDLFLKKPLRKISNREAILKFHQLNKDKKWNQWNLPNVRYTDLIGSSDKVFISLLQLFQRSHYPKASYILFKHNKLIELSEQPIDQTNIFWINIVRSPFSIYASQKNTISPMTSKAMCNNSLAFSDQWNKFIALIELQEKSANHQLIQYEVLVTNLDATMNKMREFLGLMNDWETVKQVPGKVHSWLDEDYKEMHSDINKSPQITSLKKWKNNLTESEKAVLSQYCISFKLYSEDVMLKRINKFFLMQLRLNRKKMHLTNAFKNILKPNV